MTIWSRRVPRWPGNEDRPMLAVGSVTVAASQLVPGGRVDEAEAERVLIQDLGHERQPQGRSAGRTPGKAPYGQTLEGPGQEAAPCA